MRTEDVPQNDDIQYRDYLVQVEKKFTAPTPSEFEKKLSDAEILNQTLQKLKKKFKQDFATTDNSVITVGKVMIAVLKAVLTEDLGFKASKIPAQGKLSDSQYVEVLIGLSNQTVEALSTTYRIDLSRSPLGKTTRVRENILTLQSHLRDDKFDREGYNPFFLYKEEWRLCFRTPFFPENHYAFKTGLFATTADRNRASALVVAIEKHKDYKPTLSRASEFVARMKLLLSLDKNLREGHRHFIAEAYKLAGDDYEKVEDDIRKLISQMEMTAWALPPDGTSMEYLKLTPSLSDAASFRASLDPAKPGKLLFGQQPPWQPLSAPGQTWGPWTDAYGGKHAGNWADGKKLGWWDPIDIPKKIPSHFPYTATLFDRLKTRYDDRAKLKVNSADSLS